MPGRPQPYLPPPQKAAPPPSRPQSSPSNAFIVEGWEHAAKSETNKSSPSSGGEPKSAAAIQAQRRCQLAGHMTGSPTSLYSFAAFSIFEVFSTASEAKLASLRSSSGYASILCV